MNFKLFVIVVAVAALVVCIVTSKIKKKIYTKKRIANIQNNCSRASKRIQVFMHGYYDRITPTDIYSIAENTAKLYKESYCPFRIYTSILLEQNLPTTYELLMKELTKLDKESVSDSFLPRVEIIILNTRHGNSMGRIFSVQKTLKQTKFDQVSGNDFVLVTTDKIRVYKDWDETLVSQYNSASSINKSKICISYRPTVAGNSGSQGSILSSSVAGDFIKMVRDQTSGGTHVPRYTPQYLAVSVDMANKPVFVGRDVLGTFQEPLPTLGVSSDLCFLKKKHLQTAVSRMPTDIPMGYSDILFSTIFYNRDIRFFIPIESIAFFMNKTLFDSEESCSNTVSYLRKRISRYERYLGIKYSKSSVSGRALMGIVDREDASEITVKYGSMSEFERVKSYICG